MVSVAEATVTFSVWAPHATTAAVASPQWPAPVIMTKTGQDFIATVSHARAGDLYQFALDGNLTRLDAECQMRQGEFCVVYNSTAYQWKTSSTFVASLRRVVYELHVPSFTAAGTLDAAVSRLPHLASLGVTLVELMPVADFGRGVAGWGYNPSGLLRCTMSAFGGADALKRFVDAAHAVGLGVVLDVVLNHFDPANVLLAYDGYLGPSGNGIYFYQAKGSEETAWGPRPDYSSSRVISFLLDTLQMYATEYRVDGFRFDSTVCIRKPGQSCWTNPATNADGVAFLQQATSLLGSALFVTAEDDQGSPEVTAPVAQGGLGFGSQWGYQDFFYGFFAQLTRPTNAHVNATLIAALMESSTEGTRVAFTENHDQASNQNRGRVPKVVDPSGSGHNPSLWAAKKAMMGVAVVALTNGVPMLFQGQEMLTYEDFAFPFPAKLDWTLVATNAGIVQEVRDILHLNVSNTGTKVLQVEDSSAAKVVTLSNNGLFCVLNFDAAVSSFALCNVPRDGVWQRVFSGDDSAYFAQYGDGGSKSIRVANGKAAVDLPLYSAMCYT